jgi:Fe-S-cluster containining protein
MSADQFLETHVDIILRESSFFPDVVLRMSEDKEKSCQFLCKSGCSVYQDRPETCRMFPVEVGMLYNERAKKDTLVYFFKPPEFCLGKYEKKTWTGSKWSADQGADIYRKMTIRWAGLKRLFQSNPWGNEGVYGPKGKMAFMAIYNVDQFRDFVYNSSFLKRYKIKNEILKKIRNDDATLMKLGFDWVKFFLWGIESRHIKPR